jgi:hypothetical protein
VLQQLASISSWSKCNTFLFISEVKIAKLLWVFLHANPEAAKLCFGEGYSWVVCLLFLSRVEETLVYLTWMIVNLGFVTNVITRAILCADILWILFCVQLYSRQKKHVPPSLLCSTWRHFGCFRDGMIGFKESHLFAHIMFICLPK